MHYDKVLLKEDIGFPSEAQAMEWATRRNKILGTMQIVRQEDEETWSVQSWEPHKIMYGDKIVFAKLCYLN